jgi:hypothetical protein
MKKEYDFSKAEKAKFFREDAEMYLPVYLDPDVNKYFNELAAKKNKDLSLLINDILKNNIQNYRKYSM